MAQAIGQIYVLLRLWEASYVSQDNNALHFKGEADREKALGIAEQA